jgi:hypothetical protein
MLLVHVHAEHGQGHNYRDGPGHAGMPVCPPIAQPGTGMKTKYETETGSGTVPH